MRIRLDFGPEIKLIFILLNPVDKLFSWYKYALPYGWIYESPADNLVPNIGTGGSQASAKENVTFQRPSVSKPVIQKLPYSRQSVNF